MEHAGEVTRTSSSRTFARLWPSWSTPGRKARTSSRTFVRLACGSHGARQMVTRASSPRAFDRLACGSHGARQMVTRASSPRAFDRLACGSHGARQMVTRASSPRAFGRLACGPHGARQMVTRASSPRAFGRLVLEHTVVWEIFIRSSNKSIVGGLPEKRDNTMPTWSWPNNIGVRWTSNRFCRQPSWGISSFVRAGLWVWPYRQVFALMEQTSRKPVLGTVLEWFRRLAPNKFGEPTRTLAEHACCRAEGHRAIMMSD